MATFLDLGLLTHFAAFFPFLLVFIAAYAILLKFKTFSEERSINAIIAFALASMTLFSRPAQVLITTASPWFVVLFMLILLVILAYRLIGVRESQIEKVMESEFGTPHWLIIVFVALILIGSLSIVFGPGLLEDKVEPSIPGVPATGTTTEAGTGTQFTRNVTDVLFHPKVIGFVALMLIVVFAIRTLMYGPPASGGSGKEEE